MAGDSFFTDPSKKKKRRSNNKRTTSTVQQNLKKRKIQQNSDDDNDSVSDIDEEEVASDIFDSDSDKPDDEDDVDENDDEEEYKTESAADKRRRLAKQYLENLQQEADTYDFDAKDLDNDIIASRLQKDVAEQKGYIYKFIGEKLLISESKPTLSRMQAIGVSGLSVRYPNVYTISKGMELSKWDISNTESKPKRTKYTQGGINYLDVSKEQMNNGHCDEIYAVATSPDGRYVVTGGKDKRIIVWSSENLACVKVIETRDRRGEVLGLVFRRGSDQLYAACADLKIRTYSVNQLSQLEILYGHQDLVVDISALGQERCVTVGSRDRTAMLWKVAEESRLTFRGGDSGQKKSKKKSKKQKEELNESEEKEDLFFAEGSIDCVSMLDDSHFVTGSDNGNISLWSLAKKKPLFTERQAHGIQPEQSSSKASAESDESIAKSQIPQPLPYWITTIYAVPFSDTFISGSWNGSLKVWKLEKELRSFKLIGELPNARGIVTKIDCYEDEENSKLRVFASISKEHRLGRWIKAPEGSRNALYSCSIDLQG